MKRQVDSITKTNARNRSISKHAVKRIQERYNTDIREALIILKKAYIEKSFITMHNGKHKDCFVVLFSDKKFLWKAILNTTGTIVTVLNPTQKDFVLAKERNII